MNINTIIKIIFAFITTLSFATSSDLQSNMTDKEYFYENVANYVHKANFNKIDFRPPTHDPVIIQNLIKKHTFHTLNDPTCNLPSSNPTNSISEGDTLLSADQKNSTITCENLSTALKTIEKVTLPNAYSAYNYFTNLSDLIDIYQLANILKKCPNNTCNSIVQKLNKTFLMCICESPFEDIENVKFLFETCYRYYHFKEFFADETDKNLLKEFKRYLMCRFAWMDIADQFDIENVNFLEYEKLEEK